MYLWSHLVRHSLFSLWQALRLSEPSGVEAPVPARCPTPPQSTSHSYASRASSVASVGSDGGYSSAADSDSAVGSKPPALTRRASVARRGSMSANPARMRWRFVRRMIHAKQFKPDGAAK